MDKNTWIGFGLIAVIILGFMRCGASGRSDAAQLTPEDSIRAVQRMDSLRLQKERQLQYKADSARNSSANADLGFFEAAREGVETLDTLQNEKIRVVFSSRGGLIKKVELFDVYEGKNLPEGKKSYAVNFILQDTEKTMNDKQIDAIMQKLIANLKKQLNAELR